MRSSFEHTREWPGMQGLAKAVWKLPREERESAPLVSIFRAFYELLAGCSLADRSWARSAPTSRWICSWRSRSLSMT